MNSSRLPPFLAVVLALLAGPSLRAARACERAATPLDDTTVAAAAADLVLVVEARGFSADGADVRVVEVLKADVQAPRAGASVRIAGIVDARAAEDRGGCGEDVMTGGQRYIVFLFQSLAEGQPYPRVVAGASVRPPRPAVRAEVRKGLRHPASPWRPGPAGLRTRLIQGRVAAGTRETDLVVVMHNRGVAPAPFTLAEWPPDVHSRCTLDITNVKSGAPVPARLTKTTPAENEAYFSKHGRRFTVTLAPGQAHTFLLPRITSAKPGWGYKQELGFQYYPVSAAGPHDIAARCFNLLGPHSAFVTAPLRTRL